MKTPKLEPGYSPRFAGPSTNEDGELSTASSGECPKPPVLVRLAHFEELESRKPAPYFSPNQSIRFRAILNRLVLLTRANVCQADLTATTPARLALVLVNLALPPRVPARTTPEP